MVTAPVTVHFGLEFFYNTTTPSFAGLSPGSVGLYQVIATLPALRRRPGRSSASLQVPGGLLSNLVGDWGAVGPIANRPQAASLPHKRASGELTSLCENCLVGRAISLQPSFLLQEIGVTLKLRSLAVCEKFF